MAVTIDPAVEACQAIVARINSGTAYTLSRPAKYGDIIETDHGKIADLEIDVIPTKSTQLADTLAVEDRPSPTITIWIREKLASLDQDLIDARRLLVRQIYQRVNNYDSADRRVMVWEISDWSKAQPKTGYLRTHSLFYAEIVLRVTVGASL